MSETIDFLQPRFVGDRFTGHALPLEILKDLVALDELIVETAKWLYLEENQNRKRIPKGFLEGISLKLVEVEEGSVIPKIVLVVASMTALFPASNQEYFEKARDHLIAAVDAAEHNEAVTAHLPENLLAYFERLGRGLEDGESIEFAPSHPEHPARLHRESRRNLILASVKTQSYTEEVALRGLIPELDQEKHTFTLLANGDQRIPGNFDASNEDKLLEAFSLYASGQKIQIKGIARYSRNRKIQGIESLEYVLFLEPLDVGNRIEELSLLKDGWLDGIGIAPGSELLQWFENSFETNFDIQLALPRIYPTANGGLQAEWTLGEKEISLEIDPATRTAEYQALDMGSQETTEFVLDLALPEGWKQLNEILTTVGAST